MKQSDEKKFFRKTIRLQNYDYSQPGAYFVTIVTYARKCLFGEVQDGEMALNDAGLMVAQVCSEMEECIDGLSLDAYQIMPNHFHAVFMLGMGDDLLEEKGSNPLPLVGKITLSAVIDRFKSLTTYRYIKGVKTAGWPRFDHHLWQRSFYDHVIRDEKDLEKVRDYIIANPSNWFDDEENKDRNNT